jgi:hypothetical protein
MFRKSIICLLCVTIFWSCRKDKPPVPPEEPAVQHGLSGELLVLNEGNFMFGNASLSRIDLATGSITQNYFEQVNSQAMGDVAQSMCFYQGKAYIVMNNSQKIIVADSASLKEERTINGLGSPRYLAFLHPQKAYVSDLYANAVHVINPLNGITIGNIAINGWTEEMCINSNKLFVGNWSGSATYVINTQSDEIIDSIITGKHSAWLCADKENQIWVLSSGDEQSPPALTCIDAQTLGIKRREELPFAKDICSRIIYDEAAHQLFFIAGDVFRYRINAHEGERLARVVKKNQENYYGLGIDEKRRILMVGDARNFVQRGSVSLFSIDLNFEPMGSYECGMIPGGMVIR